jgi:hypothetical protein
VKHLLRNPRLLPFASLLLLVPSLAICGSGSRDETAMTEEDLLNAIKRQEDISVSQADANQRDRLSLPLLFTRSSSLLFLLLLTLRSPLSPPTPYSSCLASLPIPLFHSAADPSQASYTTRTTRSPKSRDHLLSHHHQSHQRPPSYVHLPQYNGERKERRSHGSFCFSLLGKYVFVIRVAADTFLLVWILGWIG